MTLTPKALRYLRLVVALLLAAESFFVPRSSLFVWLVGTTFFGSLALSVAPEGRRWPVLAALIVANPVLLWIGQIALTSALLRPYTSALLVALICTAITELVRDWWDGR